MLFSSCSEWGYSLVVVFLIAVASLAVEHQLSSVCLGGFAAHGLNSCSSQALEHRLRSCGTQAWLLCSMWDLPDQGSNPCLLHWKGDSSSLSHQGSPHICVLQTFSSILWLVFSFFVSSTDNEAQFIEFFFHGLCFGVVFSHCQTQSYIDFHSVVF